MGQRARDVMIVSHRMSSHGAREARIRDIHIFNFGNDQNFVASSHGVPEARIGDIPRFSKLSNDENFLTY